MLAIAGGRGGGCDYTIKVPLVLIGKAPQCQVRLRDAAVSRFHCALVLTPDGLWAVDLLGRGGVLVNGSVARVARLDDGDELRLGGFVLRPRGLAPAAPPPEAVAAALERFTMPSVPMPVPAPDWSVAVPQLPGGATESSLAPIVSMFAEFQRQMAEQFRLSMTGMLDVVRQMHGDQMKLVWQELAEIRRLNEEANSLKARLAALPPAPAAARPAPPPPPRVETPLPAANGLPPAPTTPIPPRAVPTPTPAPAAKPEKETADVHAWLSRRVAEVQREREGRWQKVLGFLKGTP
jgi:predicted component of type VI protein secretion system